MFKIKFSFLIKLILAPFILILLFVELFLFKFFKIKNSNLSYQMMIKLFILTGGWSNNLFHSFLSVKSKNIKDDDYSKNFSELFSKNGFFLERDFVLNEKCLSFKKQLVQIKGFWQGDNYSSKEKELLDINDHKEVKFYYDSSDLIRLDLPKQLIFDPRILELATLSLKSKPILSNLNCWWSFPSKVPDKISAQWWHFDMDTPRWVKFFFYIDDCKDVNGPHLFIKGSHNNNCIPYSLRKMGYNRLPDAEINKYYMEKEILEFNCKAGSLLIENTKGLHKGKRVIEGKRLIFQLEFTSSLFGANLDNIKILSKDKEEFLRLIGKNNYIYQNFKL